MNTQQPVTKSPVLSKTLWVNFIIAMTSIVAYFYPPADEWVRHNAMIIGVVATFLTAVSNMILRKWFTRTQLKPYK